jgi:hypothetical protein
MLVEDDGRVKLALARSTLAQLASSSRVLLNTCTRKTHHAPVFVTSRIPRSAKARRRFTPALL